MNFIGVKPKKIVFFPDALFEKKYIGELWGKHFAKSKVFNVFSDEESKQYATIRLGEIFATKPNEIQSNTLIGCFYSNLMAKNMLFRNTTYFRTSSLETQAS